MRVTRNGLVMVVRTAVLGSVLWATGRGTAGAVPVAVQGTANVAGMVNTDIEQLIRHKEVELGQAQVESNVADEQRAQAARVTLDHLYADDLVHTSASGKVRDKTEYMKIWGPGVGRWTSNDKTDLRVRVYGDVAVVTGHGMLRGTQRQSGEDISTDYLFTRVWVKNKEKGWQIVAYQGTFLPSGQQPQRRKP
jgi:ketosteroid isomerase-like protein